MKLSHQWRWPTPAELAPWRVRSGYGVALLYAVFASPSVATLIAGTMLAAIGLIIRGAAAGYLQKNTKLTTSGPYAYTRNPLYLGSSLLAGGLLVAGSSWIAAVLVIAYTAVFYPAVIRFEADHLRQLHGAAYDRYAVNVPLFFPRLTPAFSDEAPFSWDLYKINREYNAAIGAFVAVALLLAKMWFW